jgi:DNA ligase 1
MQKLAEICERIASTTKKLEKTAIVADYLQAQPAELAAIAAIFLSGRPFPVWEETTLQVGGALLWRTVAELAGRSEAQLTAAYRARGDLGAVAGDVLPIRPGGKDLNVLEVQAMFRRIAGARGLVAKAALVRELLSAVTPLEAKYVIKIMTGDLRIGLKESLVEEAVAKSYGEKCGAVQRANMLLGDIGETVRLAAAGRLSAATMRLFHPLGFMLASPAESAEEALSYFQDALVEDKYDGIRAQAHCAAGEVRFFSRTRDEITESFPELPDALAGLPEDAILDGEIVAWSYSEPETNELAEDGSEPAPVPPPLRLRSGQAPAAVARASRPRELETGMKDRSGSSATIGRALPFSALQQRLGRKKVSDEMIRRVPVVYVAFDILYAGGELLIDRPLRERERILDEALAGRKDGIRHRGAERSAGNPAGFQGKLEFDAPDAPLEDSSAVKVIRAPVLRAASAEALDALFEAAQARGNEGLMIKDPESLYTPGRRGKSWLKLKRELANLDVVVTAVEWGHGKRIGVLSDYTFAVRDGNRLLNVGKAYSGLTDVEIAEMTQWFLEHTVEDQGFRRVVEPKIVLEVAFNNMMISDRHNSGFALRFPRIVRLRPDKLPEEADTIERVREIYERQGRRSHSNGGGS